MLEWLKRHAWKACNRQKRFRGSNPRLSAGEKKDSKHDEAKASGVRIPVSPQEDMWGGRLPQIDVTLENDNK